MSQLLDMRVGALSRYPNGYLALQSGEIEKCSSVHLFGSNQTVSTSYETIHGGDGVIYTFPSSAATLSLVSTASDTMDVKITGLDSSWDILTETVTLTGTTPVSTTGEFLRVNDARITTSSNAGDITITHGSDEVSFIAAGMGAQQAAIYSVPRSHDFYVMQAMFTSGTVNENKYISSRALLSKDGGADLYFWETSFVQSALTYDLIQPFYISEKTDFAIEAKSSSQTNHVAVYISGILINEN